METIDLVEQGFAWGRARIEGIGDTSLETPTPCDKWNIRQLVNHAVSATATIAGVLAADDGHDAWGANATSADAMAEMDVWPNPLEHFDKHVGFIIATAKSSPPDRTFLMNGHPQPAIMLARSVTFDSVVHGWDLAKVTGQDATIPPEIAEVFIEFASGIPDGTRGLVFAPRVEVPANASPSDRLVALLGRQP